MKRFIFPILLFIGFNSTAQVCTPGTIQGTGKGYIIPDAVTNFNDACIGQNYTQYIYIKVPKDTTVSVSGVSLPATIDSFVIKRAIGGIPPGLTADCVPAFLPAATNNPKTNFERLVVKGDSLACIKISGIVPTGTPTGTYNLTINVRAYVKVGFIAQDTSMDLSYYKIEVKNNNCYPASVQQIQQASFNIAGIAPNPFTAQTTIQLEAAQANTIELSIHNMLGQPVYGKQFQTKTGTNYLSIENQQWRAGIYYLTITDGKRRETRKIEIQ